MLIKLGVTIQYLSRPCRRALKTVDNIYKKYGEEAVITSANEGNHSPSSLHYCNNAFDIRLPETKDLTQLLEELKINLGKKFDVVDETNHIHIEFDPKNKGK